MRPLAAAQLLRVWEQGERLHALDRALLLLECARPAASWEELARLPLGRRDAQLLELRAATFGPRLELTSRCPACREPLEWGVDVASLLSAGEPASAEGELEAGEVRVRFRAPDSLDLAAAALCEDLASARGELLERCVSARGPNGEPVSPSSLPEDVLGTVGRTLAEADALAEVLFAVSCPACGHASQAQLEVAECLWSEVSPQARRLLMEVDVLARAYGWNEAEILALSSRRRQSYLELAGA